MADKKITLSIAGQEVVCNFGVNYFYKFYNEITGNDPLVKGFGEVEGVALFDTITNIFYAGYLTDKKITKSDGNLTKDDFEFHVQSMDVEGVNKMSEQFAEILGVKGEAKPGEPPA